LGGRLEALGADQCETEISAEGERDGETENGFEHRGCLLDAAEAAGVERKQRQHAEPEGEENDVGHEMLLKVSRS
jgi:hypothetical protein